MNMNMEATKMPMMNHNNMSTMGGHHNMSTMGGHHNMSGTLNMSGNHNMSGHGGGDHDGSNGHFGMDMNMVMQMYFVMSKEVTLFFKQWKTTSSGELVGSCIALLVLGILYEGLKIFRQNMMLKPLKHKIPSEILDSNTETTLLRNGALPRWSRFSKRHFLQTFLHMVQVFTGYLLMLAFMTYNVWVCIAVILGAGIGYFLFGVQPILVNNSDHCN